MAKVIMEPTDITWWQENVGRGGAIPLGRKPAQEQQNSSTQGPTESDTQQFMEQMAQETRGQWSAYRPEVIEAYKKGDRAGLSFEGSGAWIEASEARIQAALKNTYGSDESSMVDCFVAYAGRCDMTLDLDSWTWGWLVYHQQNHGTGYGKTMKDHFALVKYLEQNSGNLTVQQKLAKVRAIADEVNSFGNGCLSIVYPAYYYAAETGQDPRAFVLHLTSYTHTHADAKSAVNLLLDIIEGKGYTPPTEEYLRENQILEVPTASNTLQAAMYIADAQTGEEVIRRGIRAGGDADSTLATAMLLWALKGGKI